MRVVCPECTKGIQAPDTVAGKRVRCPHCKESFVVPVPIASSASGTVKSNSSQDARVVATPVGVVANPSSQSPQPRPKASQASSPSVGVVAMPIAEPPKGSQSPTLANDASEWERASIDKRSAAIMSGFQRPFRRPKTSAGYRAGLALSTLVMLLLPVLYLLLIVVIGSGVYWHLANNHVIVQSARGRAAGIALVLYLAPAIAGGIAILFMFKPLVAPRSKRPRIRSLTAQGEPMLFAFVEKICAEVGAPMPRRIDIDNDVNASASFRSGWWSILRGNDLVLTLGLPLVSGLSLQQFAGVLAHEFGHFSQGAGMRVAYMLRSINAWFLRAVYERDAFDDWLESMSSESDIRIGWVFYVARMAVWVSRRFLWVLLVLGHLLTGLIQQQMEYDADRYEVGMAGKDAFALTFRSMRLMGVAYQQAMGSLERISHEGKLVADFPRLMQSHAMKFPEDLASKIDELVAKEKTGLYDSHPCDSSRIAAHANSDRQGSFQSELQAAQLFVHFEAACTGVTEDMYRSIFDTKLKEKKIVPTSSVIAEESVQDAAWDSIQRYFLDAMGPERSLGWPNYALNVPTDVARAIDLLRRCRVSMKSSVQSYIVSHEHNDLARSKQKHGEWLEHLLRLRIKPDSAHLPELEQPTQIPAGELDPEKVKVFSRASALRLQTACSLMYVPEIYPTIAGADQHHAALSRVLPVVEALEQTLPAVISLRECIGEQMFGFAHIQSNRENESLIRDLIERSGVLVERIAELRHQWLDVEYPFDHAQANVSLANHLTPDLLVKEEVGQVAEAASNLLERYYVLRGRCLGCLAMAAEAVETSLGLEPLGH